MGVREGCMYFVFICIGSEGGSEGWREGVREGGRIGKGVGRMR